MAQVYAAKYLAKAALSAPRDIVNSYFARVKAIHPTALIFHCTFVCDARCEMCSNWKRGDRKADISLEDIDRCFASPLWKNIEIASLSGGEPTTRNDMVDICRVMMDRFPKLRKITLNTTGLTPHRAIPMLTEVARQCHERGVIFSVRVSIDGVGDLHGDVRHVKRAFEKAGETIRAMQALQKTYPFNFGISSTIFSKNLDDADNLVRWAEEEQLDIVFNMVRFTEAMLGNDALHEGLTPMAREERQMREFFLERVRKEPLLNGQSYIYMHYADMIGNGYHRLAPCPFQSQGVMLNPDGGFYFCEHSKAVGNVLTEDPEEIYFRAASQEHRKWIRDEKCPTCLSPCQMNVAAVKQVAPYVKFLVRASNEKRKYRATQATRPTPAEVAAKPTETVAASRPTASATATDPTKATQAT
jgi:MoaA/NifB/PqqE/SkfB family radical SAM enzyme